MYPIYENKTKEQIVKIINKITEICLFDIKIPTNSINSDYIINKVGKKGKKFYVIFNSKYLVLQGLGLVYFCNHYFSVFLLFLQG